MNKTTSISNKSTIVGSIISIIIILFTSAYHFYSLSSYFKNNGRYIEEAEKKFTELDKLKFFVADVNDALLNYTISKDDNIINGFRQDPKKIHNIFMEMKLNDQYFHFSETVLDSLNKNINSFYNHIDDYKKIEQHPADFALQLKRQRLEITDQINYLSAQLLRQRAEYIQTSQRHLSLFLTIVSGCMVIALSILVFIFIRSLNTFRAIRKSYFEQEQLNIELKKLQEKSIQDLEISTALNTLDEKLWGNYTIKEIAENALDYLTEMFSGMAGTFYIKNENEQEFNLIHSVGIPKSANIKHYYEIKDGIIGETIKKNKILFYDNFNKDNFLAESSLVKKFDLKIIIMPLVFEKKTIGVIEIGCAKTIDESVYLQFLEQCQQNIGTILTVALSHQKTNRLYEELQHQTEELETQQEELRTTNEELTHKTFLLESSEEELRVQQEELMQINSELDQKATELERQNDALQKAREDILVKAKELEHASQYKSEFMANMSHELRTPLNSILILAKLLENNKEENLSKEQIKYAHIIHHAGADLLNLINEILDLAKIESGKAEINLEKIILKNFLGDLNDLFKDIAKEKQINFHILLDKNVPTEISTDEIRLKQIIRNLLSNAFKFTPENGNIDLMISADQDQLIFKVKDTGIGISEEKQELIFEAFQQEDGSTSRKYGGTGLGLSISKAAVQLLHGKILLESTLHQGSTFTIIIPMQQKNEVVTNNQASDILFKTDNDTIATIPTINPIPKQTVKTTAESDKNLILIIEDDRVFADILRDYTLQNGFDAEIAYDGEKGYELAEKLMPHAIILDVMLPILNGWEVLKKIKANKRIAHIPVHMMSAGSYLNDEPMHAGAISFMSKPISEQNLKQTFEKIKTGSHPIQHILLIEDQVIQSDYIKNSFQDKNMLITQAFSGQEALELLQHANHSFDCIILDLNLPDKNGMDLLSEIKSRPEFKDLPIIVNTEMELDEKQTMQILKHSQAMIMKSNKSNERLMDEVSLFLNKIRNENQHELLHKIKPAPESSLSGKRILIVDDDMRNIFALSAALEEIGMQIDVANNGQEAVDFVKNNATDIILMDIMMPVMDGYEAMAQIRAHLQSKKLPIIAVTAKAMAGDKEKAIEAGASDYVSKPINLDSLIALIKVWLS